MWDESAEQPKALRTGLTTGSCATACAVASAIVLLRKSLPNKELPQDVSIDSGTDNSAPHRVSITLPKGKTVELDVVTQQLTQHSATASTVKDAGDDPDVTHGATLRVLLTLQTSKDIDFVAGEGVGTVTREGLLLPIGEPAINPVPRQMIRNNLKSVAEICQYSGGFVVTISVENGLALAKKTMNPRLGIVGGISILGTTGIVRPFSCAAWIASIYQGIDVAKANAVGHIAASTGNSSEQAIKDKYQLDDIALIEMGDFAGAVLKHMRKTPVNKLSICGGFGKITKLANGHMDLNSRVSKIDFAHIAEVAKNAGADTEVAEKILQANTSIEALQICQQADIDLANTMCDLALKKAMSIVPESVAVEVYAINRQGHFIGHAVSPGGQFQ